MVYHRYPKLAIVCKTFNQFIIAFSTHRGPKPDVDEFKDLIKQTKRRVGLRVVVADAGYDSESNHEFARQVIGVRTIIPAKHGRPTDKPARGKYRRLMQTRFDQHTYRQRTQVETTVSMIKRRQGNHILGKTYWSQTREMRLMVLTHNIMILWCGILFYRAAHDSIHILRTNETRDGMIEKWREFTNFLVNNRLQQFSVSALNSVDLTIFFVTFGTSEGKQIAYRGLRYSSRVRNELCCAGF